MRTQDTEKEIAKIMTKQKTQLNLSTRENAILTLFGVSANDIRRTAQIER